MSETPETVKILSGIHRGETAVITARQPRRSGPIIDVRLSLPDGTDLGWYWPEEIEEQNTDRELDS